MDQAKLITEDEAVKVLGISKATLYRLRRDRSISCYKVRGRVMFSGAQLADYLARVEQRAESGATLPAQVESAAVRAA
jgi:excisionase family DNA binding protein